MRDKIAVAVDGPSGAGKSTLSKSAAAELGILYVDTGAMYRTVACAVAERGISPQDEAGVSALLPELSVAMRYGEDGLQHMFLNGRDCTDDIRKPEISAYASAVSRFPAVRSFLLERQRSLARESSVIMDGRDIGTVVLPKAEVKIFLTAPLEKRAERRFRELRERGTPQTLEMVREEMRKRDADDAARMLAPLKPAEDAVVLDTGDLSFAESREALLRLIRRVWEA